MFRLQINPYTPSNMNSISAAYRCHENTKRQANGQRIWEVEHVCIQGFSSRGYHFLQMTCWPPNGDSVVMGWLWDRRISRNGGIVEKLTQRSRSF